MSIRTKENPSSEYTVLAAQVDEIESEVDYVMLARQVDEVYAALGARVMRGVSFAGEDPAYLYVPREKTSYPNYPA